MTGLDAPDLLSHRQAAYVVTLVDEQDRAIMPLPGVTGGEVVLSATALLRGSGSLDLVDRDQPIDWSRHRVRIEYVLASGSRWGLGVWLLAAPSETYAAASRSWRVDLLPKTAILDADALPASYSVAKGTNLVASARAVIAGVGEGERVIATPTDKTAPATMVWPPGTSRLRIVNDLLEAAGYWGVWCDTDGFFRLEPYVEPAHRAPAWTFSAGATAIHLPDFSREHDLASIPNRVVCVGQSEADKPALVGVATNERPDHPLSYQARGRWVTVTEEGVEATTQAELEAIARRKLLALMAAKATLEIEHLPIPLAPNQVVEYVTAGVAVRASVRELRYSLQPTDLTRTTLVEVMDL